MVSQSRSDGYVIQLNGSIPIRAGLDHELSHVREGSLDSPFWKPFKTMIESWYENTVPTDMKGRTAYDITNTVCRDAMNIIEDIRIESIDGEIYMGRKRAYNSMCKDAGLEWNDNGYEPKMGEIHGYVLAKRFFRDDMIPDMYEAEVDRIFEQSRCTTVRGIHKVFHDWLDGSLGNYILEQIKILNEKKEKQESTNQKNYEHAREQRDKIDSIISEMLDDTPKEEMTKEQREQLTELTHKQMKAEQEAGIANAQIYQSRREIERDANHTIRS